MGEESPFLQFLSKRLVKMLILTSNIGICLWKIPIFWPIMYVFGGRGPRGWVWTFFKGEETPVYKFFFEVKGPYLRQNTCGPPALPPLMCIKN